VVVEDGQIVSISEPRTRHCPLRDGLYGHPQETVETVRESVERHIRDWGMFTAERIIRTTEYPVSFGVSEILASGISSGIIDAVVCVCEGAGSVVSDDPAVVQGIGAHMTGLVETTPEAPIIAKLEEAGAHVVSKDASMDQLEGYRRAKSLGYERVGITVSGRSSRQGIEIRNEAGGAVCAIASIHNSGMSRGDAQRVASSCDIVTSCASRWAREVVAPRAVMQLGLRIPVLILTQLGKRLALSRLEGFGEPLIVGSGTIPRLAPDQPDPLW
jgi:putative methanogenesis marker protein 8